jgi:hypothetical protein
MSDEQAEAQRQFWQRLARQQKDREQQAAATTERTTEVRRLLGESLPGEEPEKRDWATALAAVGLKRLYRC